MLGFDTLITEKIIRFVYLAATALMGLSCLLFILGSWKTAFSIIRWSFPSFLGLFLGAPIGGLLAFLIGFISLRLGCEALLVQFLLYRQTKAINDKMPTPAQKDNEE